MHKCAWSSGGRAGGRRQRQRGREGGKGGREVGGEWGQRDIIGFDGNLSVEHVGIERGQANVQRVFAVAFCNAVRAGLAFKP